MLKRLSLVACGLVVSAAMLWSAAPAGAVQTTTWGIVAAPAGHSYRSSLAHPADGSTVHDAVIVFNRTGGSIKISLSVLGASYANGAYQFTNGHSGWAAGASLGSRVVTLGPHQQSRVPVTIHLPRGTKASTLAAIAAESSPVNDGSLVVEQRLVVLIRATPTTSLIPRTVRDIGLWSSLALILLIAAAFLVKREARRLRSATLPNAVTAVPVPQS